jgi:hypothetical protein
MARKIFHHLKILHNIGKHFGQFKRNRKIVQGLKGFFYKINQFRC